MAGVDIDTLTMEQYLALSRENQAPGQSCSEFFPSLLPDPQRDEWTDSPQELSILGISSKRPLSKAIQTMADHSQKWHDGTTSRNIESSSSNDGLAALVGCQICEGPRLDKDYPLNEEVKQVKEVRYREFGRTTPFNGNNGGKFRVGPPGILRVTHEVLRHLLPPKELNPGSFTLPCTIGKFNFYAITDLDMSKITPLGIVENIIVKIDKFIFPSDFVIIDNTPSETTILERPFLATIHAEIDVFAGKFSLGINEERISFDMMRKYHPRTIAGVDVDTLTMEQYLALLRENQAPGVIRKAMGGQTSPKDYQYLGPLQKGLYPKVLSTFYDRKAA
ncbi:hypothetical protein Tco_0413066 [Tanacetum coccineum]